MRQDIVVVGSANMDLVAKTASFPKPGETVFAGDFAMYPGGKGANQAVCCARLGGNVQFVGMMGADIFRDKLVASLRAAGVKLDHLMYNDEEPTGTALILVDDAGENEIVVVSGSNMALRPDALGGLRDVISKAAVLLMQLEIPLETVIAAVEIASTDGTTVILNPAPAAKLPESLLRKIDFLTPNETEAELLTGIRVADIATAERAARYLRDMGVANVVITLGNRGCLWLSDGKSRIFPATRVRAIDTTAAGDAFNGALAYSLAKGETAEASFEFANTVAAYAVTKMGTQSSMPTLEEISCWR
jgi:ribokinase